jgi:hypothetical protein
MWRKNHRRLLVLALLLTIVACRKHGPPPLALEECDPAGYVPCVQQSAFLSVPVADTNLRLTYSSRWKDRKTEKANWNAQGVGRSGRLVYQSAITASRHRRQRRRTGDSEDARYSGRKEGTLGGDAIADHDRAPSALLTISWASLTMA